MNGRVVGRAVLNFLLFAGLTLGLAQFQGVVWYQFFGWVPAPSLWLLPIVYLSQNRSWPVGILQTYLLCLGMATVTVMPLGLLMANCLLVYLTTMSFKGRIFWEGMGYQILVAAVAVGGFNLYQVLTSWIFEVNPIAYPQILDWLGQIVLTSAMSPFFQLVFEWFDEISGHGPVAESEMQT